MINFLKNLFKKKEPPAEYRFKPDTNGSYYFQVYDPFFDDYVTRDILVKEKDFDKVIKNHQRDVIYYKVEK